MLAVRSIEKSLIHLLRFLRPILLSLSLVSGSIASAQIKSGVITGVVIDSAAAVLPGASVSVVNQETNITTTALTDDTGNFTVPYLAPGTYTVNVDKSGSGFSKYSRTNISVSTAQTVKIEVVLQTGTVSDKITVMADAATLQTSIITPCKGCFLKYNIDAFAGRLVSGPNGKALADLFWYGNAAATYGDLRSPSIWNMNMSLEKSFKVWERYSLNVAAQATNVFNHTQFKPVVNSSFGATVQQSTLDNAANAPLKLKLGQLLDTASTFGTFTQDAYDARQIEFVVRIRF
jgi:hypothetical protein